MAVRVESQQDDQCYLCWCSPEEYDFYRCDGCGRLVCADCLPPQDDEAAAEFCEECLGDASEEE